MLMPSQAGQSAIARHRSVEHAQQPTLVHSKGPSASRNSQPAHYALTNIAVSADDVSEASLAMSNQFSALSNAPLSNLGSIREIGEVSQTRVRVRLSRQPCVVVGTCTLWIKYGTVSVCGALLNNTQKPHHLYSPTSHSLPVIEAVDGPAEFELDSSEIDLAGHGLQSLTSLGFPGVWKPHERNSPPNMTYAVIDYHFRPDPSASARYRILDTSNWRQLISTLSGTRSVSKGSPRFLIHGARNSGTSTFAQNLLNRLTSQYGPETGIAFVDLEAVRPAFTPPGSICLQQVKTAVFGPPFTRPAANSGPVAKCHFVSTDGGLTPWYFHCCLDLLAFEATKRGAESKKPVIIHAPKWLTALSLDSSPEAATMKQQFWNAVRPTNILYLSSSEDGFLASVPQLPGTISERVPQKPLPQFELSRQRDMSMQAYFHLIFNKTGGRLFSNTPVLYDDPKTFQLSFDEWGPLKGAIIDSTVINSEHVNEAVAGQIVAVLSVSEEALSSTSFWEAERGTNLYQFDSNLATTPFSPEGVACLGFGFVRDIHDASQTRTLTTPIKEEILHRPYHKGEATQLVLVVPGGDSRWLEKEITRS